MTREEFYNLTDILNSEVLGNFMHGGEADELLAMFEEAVDHSNILEQEEPVSNDLEEASNNALDKISKKYDIVNIKGCLEMFRLGAKWQKEQMKEE